MLRDPSSVIIGSEEDVEEVSAIDGSVSQLPVGVREPRQPTKSEVDKHNLTHVHYRDWCPHCLAARRPNSHHKSQHLRNGRSVPLFCSDYCYPRDAEDEEPLTTMVGRLFPAGAFFASGCDTKGADDDVVRRLSQFFKESGVAKMVYKSDQESPLKTAIEETLRRTGKSGTFESYEAVPEYSAVGESASNGRAERAVQIVEDLLRTLKSALESRIGARLPVKHPVMRWLIEHTASLLNRFKVMPNGMTPYQALHGKRHDLKIVEFGEQVFYSVPKRLRSKLCLRWRLGTYLGQVTSSNEHYVGVKNGNVLRARSICRVVEASRWSASTIENILGTPAKPCPVAQDGLEARIEEFADPHIDGDHAMQADLDAEGVQEVDDLQADKKEQLRQIRLTTKDFRSYGYSDNCPKC